MDDIDNAPETRIQGWSAAEKFSGGTLPENAEFGYDEYGNYYVEYVQDGTVNYNALKQGDEAMGSVTASYPEGTEGVEDTPFWLSLAVIE